MHRANAVSLERAFEAEIEVGRIDADEHVRFPVEQAFAQAATQPQQAWQVAHDFCQPHHRECAAIVPRIETGTAHRSTADAYELRIWMAMA